MTIYKLTDDLEDVEELIKEEYEESGSNLVLQSCESSRPMAKVLLHSSVKLLVFRPPQFKAFSPMARLLPEEIQVNRDPFVSEKLVPTKPLTLTDEQAECMETIHECIDSGEKHVVLIQGLPAVVKLKFTCKPFNTVSTKANRSHRSRSRDFSNTPNKPAFPGQVWR